MTEKEIELLVEEHAEMRRLLDGIAAGVPGKAESVAIFGLDAIDKNRKKVLGEQS
jgi:hypothetical protein